MRQGLICSKTIFQKKYFNSILDIKAPIPSFVDIFLKLYIHLVVSFSGIILCLKIAAPILQNSKLFIENFSCTALLVHKKKANFDRLAIYPTTDAGLPEWVIVQARLG